MHNLNKENCIQVLSKEETNPTISIVIGNGKATAIVWPGMGAKERSLYLIEMEENSYTKKLNHSSEAVYYVKSGTGKVFDLKESNISEIQIGNMVHIGVNTQYYFEAGKNGLNLIGGPCPFDPNFT